MRSPRTRYRKQTTILSFSPELSSFATPLRSGFELTKVICPDHGSPRDIISEAFVEQAVSIQLRSPFGKH
jgi:hypothetical protein